MTSLTPVETVARAFVSTPVEPSSEAPVVYRPYPLSQLELNGPMVVFCTEDQCTAITNTSTLHGHLSAEHTRDKLVVVCCRERGVPRDYFAKLCSAAGVDLSSVPVYWGTNKHSSVAWAVAQQVGADYDIVAAPCTIDLEPSQPSDLSAFF